MKTMTCRQLGGACDYAFRAATFDEMAELSRQHGMEMFDKGDADHIDSMQKMRELLNDPEAMKAWFEGKKKEFEALPDD